jgi:hypothetical protein
VHTHDMPDVVFLILKVQRKCSARRRGRCMKFPNVFAVRPQKCDCFFFATFVVYNRTQLTDNGFEIGMLRTALV